jgi:hypothetical protein
LCGNFNLYNLKDIPEPLIKYIGIKRTILDFVRTELRNAVHNAKRYSRMELMHYSNIVLSCYLFVIEDNLLFLKKSFLKEFQYLKTVVEDKNYVNLDKVYIELLGHEEYADIDVTGTELIDEFDLLSDIEDFTESENDDDIQDVGQEKRTGSIIEIASDTLQFEIIGQGGSGKTTTLHKILYNNAKEILEGNSSLKIPFFIHANEYSPTNDFIKILSNKIDNDWILNSLQKGEIQLLIDGLNEITENYKYEAYREINNILKNYPENSVILTERKLSFERRFDIPIFELKELTDEKVLAFIQAYAENYSEIIWRELQSNDNMLNLAYNPLMLKMILSVSKNGSIPKNRGLLYQLFIKTIFQREKTKKNQIRTDTKLDVLSHIAFVMRQNGTTKLSVTKFKNDIKEKIFELNSSVSINTLYSELLDNLIINETQNEEVSFFHETYQEYFCAIQLKSFFEISDELPISLIDRRWFEALVMCGEILKNEERAILFFEYLFRGKKMINGQKPLKNFSKEDFNNNINIACKIAYSLEPIKPDIYKLAEKYLSNYIVLWKYVFYEKKYEPIPITELFASISSLNSKKLSEKIIKNLGWAYIWLYSGEEEENNPYYIENIIPKYENSLHNDILNVISNHTPDFSVFYDTINSSLNYYSFSKTISNQLEKISNGILHNTPENQLKLYYKSISDFKVLKIILKSDIDFISKYNFNEHEEKENKQVIGILIRYHIQNEVAHKIFIDKLFLLSRKTISYLLERLFFFCQYQVLLQLFEILLDENENVFFENISLLQAIPFESLPYQLKNTFSSPKQEESIEYSLVIQKTITEYSCVIPNELKNSISINSLYTIQNKHIVRIQTINKYFLNGRQAIILRLNLDAPQIPLIGSISNSNFKTDYISYKLTKKRDKCIFLLPFYDTDFRVNSVMKSGDEFNINNDLIGTFAGWSTESIEDKNLCKINFQLVTASNLNIELPKTGNLILNEIGIDIENPKAYHPAHIINNIKLLKTIEKNITEKAYVFFIQNLGLTYMFHKNIVNVNYGIVLAIYNNRLKIFSILQKQIIELNICSDEISKFSTEKIVVLEKNNTVNLIDEDKEFLNRIGYIESEIIHINEEREEGFIKVISDKYSSDYFFHFRSCNFIPQIGDYVKFIPALNPSKNYVNEPIALKIYKIELPKCKVLFSKYDLEKERIWGKAIDIITDEELFFSLNFGQEKYILNFKDEIKENNLMEYSIIKGKKDSFLKLIKLVKMVE